jgi:hypothetical protein
MTQININKRAYQKPSMKVFPLNTQPQLLAGSFPIDPTNPTTDQW